MNIFSLSGAVRILCAALAVLLCATTGSPAASRQQTLAPQGAPRSSAPSLPQTTFPPSPIPEAHAAAPESAAPEHNARISPQGIRAAINKDGPQAWPQNQWLSTVPAQPAPPAVSGGGQAKAPAQPVPAPNAAPQAQIPSPSAPFQAPGPGAGSLPPPSPPGTKSSLPPLPAHLLSPAGTKLPLLPANEATPSAQTPPPASQQAADPIQARQAAPPPPAAPVEKTPLPPLPPLPQPATPSAQNAPPRPAGNATAPTSGREVTGRIKGAPPSANATAASETPAPPVVYVDEKGNPVPKPADPAELMAQAETAMSRKEYKAALDALEQLKKLPIPRDQLEKALYLISDATWELYKDKGLEGYEAIISTTSEALNVNPRSGNAPAALLRLGEANLLVGNLREAEAYFRARRSAHPPGPDVPVSFLKLGLALEKAKLYDRAAAIFRDIVQNFQESPAVRSASVRLGVVLDKLGEKKEAAIVVDFVEKRWPRYYLEDPSFLLTQADLALWAGKLQEALQQYWLYYNLEPTKPGNDKVLQAIGDIYLRQGRTEPALEVFREIIRAYPETEGANYALLRLAEKSVHDDPAVTKEEMAAVFANPGTPPPQAAYAQLMKKVPNEPVGILSYLKLALWQLWSKQYTDAIRSAADYIDLHPEEPGATRARQIILEAFDAEAAQDMREENYGRILILWNGFPLIREKHTPLSDDLRMALAKGHLERGEDAAAMELLSYFLTTPKNAKYGDYAFTFYFNKYLAAEDWNALLELGKTVAAWDFPPKMRGELDYAMALSAENLGMSGRALALWQKLAPRNDIPLYEKAYATYFLAKDAERRKDIKDAYAYSKATLDLFTRLENEGWKGNDPERVKEVIASLMDICEVSNRIPEALEWLERHNAYVPEGSPEFAGLRFREARLYRKLGDNAKSRALLEQIVRAEPDSPFGKAAEAELRTFEVSRDLDRFAPGK